MDIIFFAPAFMEGLAAAAPAIRHSSRYPEVPTMQEAHRSGPPRSKSCASSGYLSRTWNQFGSDDTRSTPVAGSLSKSRQRVVVRLPSRACIAGAAGVLLGAICLRTRERRGTVEDLPGGDSSMETGAA